MNTSVHSERTVMGEGFERLHSVVHEWTESGRIVGAVVLVRVAGELRYAEEPVSPIRRRANGWGSVRCSDGHRSPRPCPPLRHSPS